MTEPQVWTLIGINAASLTALLTLISTMLLRVMRAEFATVRADFRAELATQSASVDNVRLEVNACMDGLERRFDHLDKDVRALARHIFPDRP